VVFLSKRCVGGGVDLWLPLFLDKCSFVWANGQGQMSK